jgi:hypothetical protein
MAKRKATRGARKTKAGRKPAVARRSAKRPKAAARRSATKPRARKSAAAKPVRKRQPAGPKKTPRLDRVRRTLDDNVPTPPSSLDLNRRGSAARTGRAEMQQNRDVHGSMTRGITGGDVDVNLEQAYFSGDETPGGDNPTPDQDIVDDIGKAIGVEYQDNEELRGSDKVADRDKRRWELDPASAEDYKERK